MCVPSRGIQSLQYTSGKRHLQQTGLEAFKRNGVSLEYCFWLFLESLLRPDVGQTLTKRANDVATCRTFWNLNPDTHTEQFRRNGHETQLNTGAFFEANAMQDQFSHLPHRRLNPTPGTQKRLGLTFDAMSNTTSQSNTLVPDGVAGRVGKITAYHSYTEIGSHSA